MAEKYYVISGSEDGDIGIFEYTEKELLKFLNEDSDFLPDIIATLKGNEDPRYWSDSMLIIKGEIKVPKPKKTVESWEI